MLLVSFDAGLPDVAGRQVRYASPQTVHDALRIALAVQDAEKQEEFNNSFYTRFDNSVSLHSRPPSRTYSESEGPRYSGATRAPSNANSHRSSVPSRATGHSNRNARTKEALCCYECHGVGRFARECLTRLRREEGKPLFSEKRGQVERSKRSGSWDMKPPPQTKRESRSGLEKQGNGKEA